MTPARLWVWRCLDILLPKDLPFPVGKACVGLEYHVKNGSLASVSAPDTDGNLGNLGGAWTRHSDPRTQ